MHLDLLQDFELQGPTSVMAKVLHDLVEAALYAAAGSDPAEVFMTTSGRGETSALTIISTRAALAAAVSPCIVDRARGAEIDFGVLQASR